MDLVADAYGTFLKFFDKKFHFWNQKYVIYNFGATLYA